MTTDNEMNQPRSTALDAIARRTAMRTRPASETGRQGAPIAFVYLRVSTKEQARTGGGEEGYSIPTQRQVCYATAEQLNAVVVDEYVDAGESAKTANRPELQKMLAAIKTARPDYVIVHKIDRLARNRADDIAINLMLKKYGVKLVSCTENIDDTPSGRLLYGLLAEIAQFYSGNLAQEVMKGLVAKAEEGGTPFRAPLGYRNRREIRDGVDYSWVDLDPERAELVRWCLEQYATGEWSAIDLTLVAQDKGLTSRPTPKKPAKPISLTGMYHLLQNPYHMGVVSYRGIHYVGKHPKLIEPDTWLAIQDTLAAHNQAGEKDRIHTHYLRGTIYCSNCGGRLVFSRHKGNGGIYDYFLCVKKKTRANNCTRRAVRVDAIEDGIATFYGSFQVRTDYADQIAATVRAELAIEQRQAADSLARARTHKQQIEDERRKLLQAHYAGAVPQDLLGSEMKRLTRALIQADAEIAGAQTTTEDIAADLDAALLAAQHCEQAYLSGDHRVRRLLNQGFFKKLYIGEDGSVERAEMQEPFAALLNRRYSTSDDVQLTITDRTAEESRVDGTDGLTAVTTVPVHTDRAMVGNVFIGAYGVSDVWEDTTTPGEADLSGRGVKETYLVELRGIEPLTFSMRTRRATNCATAPSYLGSRLGTGRTIAGWWGGGFATPRFSRRLGGSRGGGAGRGLRRRGPRRRCRRGRCH
jgi:site-specific DNA recombinase